GKRPSRVTAKPAGGARTVPVRSVSKSVGHRICSGHGPSRHRGLTSIHLHSVSLVPCYNAAQQTVAPQRTNQATKNNYGFKQRNRFNATSTPKSTSPAWRLCH